MFRGKANNFQTFSDGEIEGLFTVTFFGKVDFCNCSLVHCLQLYGILNIKVGVELETLKQSPVSREVVFE